LLPIWHVQWCLQKPTAWNVLPITQFLLPEYGSRPTVHMRNAKWPGGVHASWWGFITIWGICTIAASISCSLCTIAATISRLWTIAAVFTRFCRLPTGFQYWIGGLMYGLWLLSVPWTNALQHGRLLLQRRLLQVPSKHPSRPGSLLRPASSWQQLPCNQGLLHQRADHQLLRERFVHVQMGLSLGQ